MKIKTPWLSRRLDTDEENSKEMENAFEKFI